MTRPKTDPIPLILIRIFCTVYFITGAGWKIWEPHWESGYTAGWYTELAFSYRADVLHYAFFIRMDIITVLLFSVYICAAHAPSHGV